MGAAIVRATRVAGAGQLQAIQRYYGTHLRRTLYLSQRALDRGVPPASSNYTSYGTKCLRVFEHVQPAARKGRNAKALAESRSFK